MRELSTNDRTDNDRDIHCYLVRYGAVGHVGWVGSIDPVACGRGDRVVVATDRGLELGEVLEVGRNQKGSSAKDAPTGELLRVATEADRQSQSQLGELHVEVLRACQELLSVRALPVTALDAEPLLDGRTIIIYYLGEPTVELGPVAVELSKKAHGRRVQFEQAQLATSPADKADQEQGPAAVRGQKRSKQEMIKESSHGLRGTIMDELSREGDKFPPDDVSLLKFHGTYQQDDRDARKRRSPGAGKAGKKHIFMVRTKVPGGRLTAGQLLGELDLGDRFANGTLRITTRQGLQLHGVSKSDLWQTMHEINGALLSTLGACGDVVRNVMCCPAPLREDRVRSMMQSTAAQIAQHLAPRTAAYREVWIDGEKVDGPARQPDPEPIYGPVYLPRKFKIGIAHPDDNCIDVHTHDVGLLAIVEPDGLVGYNVIVGGGLGNSPSVKDTFPRLGDPVAFVPYAEALRVVTAIVEVQRDYGNRENRRRARMKYLVDQWGAAAFKSKVEEYFGGPLDDARPITVRQLHDHLGWHPQGDGRYWFGLFIENGRIQDQDAVHMKTGLRAVLQRFRVPVRLTPQQNLLLCDLEPSWKDELYELLGSHGIKRDDEISTVRRHAMACPALPTCGLAITESERVLPGVIDRLEAELPRLGLAAENFTIRMTGCPNACSRPYTADIGLVGKAVGKYTILIGGRMLGDRLNFVYQDLVPFEELVDRIVPLLAYFASDSLPREALGDFCHRKGRQALLQFEAEWHPTTD